MSIQFCYRSRCKQIIRVTTLPEGMFRAYMISSRNHCETFTSLNTLITQNQEIVKDDEGAELLPAPWLPTVPLFSMLRNLWRQSTEPRNCQMRFRKHEHRHQKDATLAMCLHLLQLLTAFPGPAFLSISRNLSASC